MTATLAGTPVTRTELTLMREAAAVFGERVGLGREVYVWPAGRLHASMSGLSDRFGILDDLGGADDTAPAREHLAWLTGTIWEAVTFAGGIQASGWQHFPAAVAPGLLAALEVPSSASLPPGQPALLAAPEHGQAERHAGAASLQAAYQQRHRTRILEDIGRDSTCWAATVGGWLTTLSGGAPVTAAVFESAPGDETFGPHGDEWLGVILQVHGAKSWRIGEGLLNPNASEPAQLTTRPGDVLLLPKGMPHHVDTPADPGHSVHIAFAVDRATGAVGGDARRES